MRLELTATLRKMTESEQKVIPRFTSFRPKAPQSHKTSQGQNNVASDSTNSYAEDAKRGSGSQSRLHDHYRDQESKRRKVDVKESSDSPATLKSVPAESSKGYIVDKFGDQRNLSYGSLHRYAVPLYRRAGAGRVIGSYSKINRAESGERAIILNDRTENDSVRILPPASWKQRKKIPESPNIMRSSAKTPDPNERSLDFLSFDIVASATKSVASDEGSDVGSSVEDQDPSLQAQQVGVDEKRREKARLWEVIRKNKQSSEAWNTYIEWLEANQSPLIIASELSINVHTIISTYQDALENVDNERAQESLVCRMMRHGRGMWDGKETVTLWRKHTEKYPLSQLIWQHYADSHQYAPDFHYSDVQDLYKTRLKFLQTRRFEVRTAVRQDSDGTQQTKHTLTQASLYTSQIQSLLRFTLMMRDAGYTEQGIAVWQATLELNFLYLPQHNPLGIIDANSHEKMLQALEDFWESGIPRIGEEGSYGWRRFMGSASHSWVSKEDVVAKAKPPGTWASWVELEKKTISLSSIPARYEDEILEEDNDRVIMFSDIKDALFTYSEQDPKLLINAFLTFCHLPHLDNVVGPDCAASLGPDEQRAGGDPFLQGHLLDKFLGALTQYSSETVARSPCTCYRRTPDTYLVSEDWFSPFSIIHHLDEDLETKIFAARVLGQLIDLDQEFAKLCGVYHLGLECRLDPEKAEKKAKAMFKRFKSEIALSDLFCNVYARVLTRKGSWDTARHVFESALKVGDKVHGKMDPRKIQHLHALVSGNVVRDKLTMARKSLDDHMHTLPTAADLDAIQEAQVYSLHLLDKYLQPSHYNNMSAALSFHVSYEASIPPQFFQSPTLEICHQYLAKLLYHHSVRSPSSLAPVRFREQIANSIARFPHNTIFQTLYTWNERRYGAGISAVANAVLHAPFPNSREDASDVDVTRHILAIHNALSSPPAGLDIPITSTSSANVNTVRATFERALHPSSSAHHCPALWRWYLLWEISLVLPPIPPLEPHLNPSTTTTTSIHRDERAKAMQEKRIKGIWWRAVTACPWVKELHLLAFEESNRKAMGMREEDLKAVYEMLDGREIRVRVRKGVAAAAAV